MNVKRRAILMLAFCLAGCGQYSPIRPALKIELDMNSGPIYWADSPGGGDAEVYVLVHNSRHPNERRIIANDTAQSVFFLNDLPEAVPGDEYVIEVWDDDKLTAAQARTIASAIANSGKLIARVYGQQLRIVAATDAAIDAAKETAIATVELNGWDFLGRAKVVVGDNGLPSATFANPVSIVTDDNRKVLGRVYFFQDGSSSAVVDDSNKGNAL